MECNKDEAKRAMDIAEKKLSESDYDGAKRFVNKAENLYPKLDGLEQVLMMINVYINGGGKREADWYRVLGVDPLADEEAVKKQYKKLALLLHPDKNKFKGAEGAFKLVSQAWCLLSDKVKRDAYDLKRKPKEATTNGMPKPPNGHKPASSNRNQNAKPGVVPSAKGDNKPAPVPETARNGNQTARNGADTSAKASKMPKPVPNPRKRASSSGAQNAKHGVEPSGKASSNKPKSVPVPKPMPVPAVTFWTMCSGCKTRGEYVKERYLDKAILCPNCGNVFVATESPWASFVWQGQVNFSSTSQQRQSSAQTKETNKKANAKGAAAASSSSRRVSSPSVSATAKFRPQVSFTGPGFNFSSSPQQCSAQNASGATFSSSKRGPEELREVVADTDKILKKPKTHHL